MILTQTGKIRDIKNWILASAVFAITIFLIYYPAYLQFHNIPDLIRWATGGGAKGHFFNIGLLPYIKKLVLIILTMIAPLFILFSSIKFIINDKNKYFLLTFIVSILSLLFLYASSPINGEIEQLLISSIFLTVLSSLFINLLKPTQKKIAFLLIIISFLSIIPIKSAFNIKDEIVDGVLTLTNKIPADANVYNIYMSDYIKLLKPNLNLVGSFSASTSPVYFLDSENVFPKDLNEKQYTIIEKWQREKTVFEKPLSKFMDLPYSWRGTYILAKIEKTKQQ